MVEPLAARLDRLVTRGWVSWPCHEAGEAIVASRRASARSRLARYQPACQMPLPTRIAEGKKSVRAPSSINNLVGVRPTVGLVSRIGMSPLDSQRDTPGPMGRTVEDVTRLLDALVVPVWSFPPVLNGDRGQTPQGALTFIGSALQWPVIVVPMGFVAENLPMGMQLLGRPWSEGQLIAFAYAYEHVTHHRQPPTSAPPLADSLPTPTQRRTT
jgi:hypothetical protein